MPQKITAFNTNITIHQEYYYNPSEVISNPEKSIYTAIAISKYLTEVAASIFTIGLFIINPFEMEISPKYKFLFHTYSIVLISS